MNLSRLAYEIRLDVLDVIKCGNAGHIGGDMSVTEILTTLYFSEMNVDPSKVKDENRDRFILSKGHSVEAYYAVLSKKGFLNLDEVKKNFSKYNTKYIGHPNNKLPGIEMNTGSLGHGLSVGVGMALAGKMDKKNYRVYVVMGDGEVAEGSIWEAAMAAGHYKLDNLCAIVDRNNLQISGTTEEVMSHKDLAKRFEPFGWNVIDVKDGNDVDSLLKAYKGARDAKDMPTMIIAHTIKGKGSSVMENKAPWHHKLPNDEELEIIKSDINKKIESFKD